MNRDRVPRPDYSGLLYGSKSPAENVGVNRHVKPAEPHSPCDNCLLISAAMRSGTRFTFCNLTPFVVWFFCVRVLSAFFSKAGLSVRQFELIGQRVTSLQSTSGASPSMDPLYGTVCRMLCATAAYH